MSSTPHLPPPVASPCPPLPGPVCVSSLLSVPFPLPGFSHPVRCSLPPRAPAHPAACCVIPLSCCPCPVFSPCTHRARLPPRHTVQQETNRTIAASASALKQTAELLRGCPQVRSRGPEGGGGLGTGWGNGRQTRGHSGRERRFHHSLGTSAGWTAVWVPGGPRPHTLRGQALLRWSHRPWLACCCPCSSFLPMGSRGVRADGEGWVWDWRCRACGVSQPSPELMGVAWAGGAQEPVSESWSQGLGLTRLQWCRCCLLRRGWGLLVARRCQDLGPACSLVRLYVLSTGSVPGFILKLGAEVSRRRGLIPTGGQRPCVSAEVLGGR